MLISLTNGQLRQQIQIDMICKSWYNMICVVTIKKDG